MECSRSCPILNVDIASLLQEEADNLGALSAGRMQAIHSKMQRRGTCHGRMGWFYVCTNKYLCCDGRLTSFVCDRSIATPFHELRGAIKVVAHLLNSDGSCCEGSMGV